jgi:dTDP-4-amino-4,6-dideoxygalactose transaminase
MNPNIVKYINLPLQFKSLQEEIIPAITTVLKSGDYIMGSEVLRLEKRFAEYCGSPYALGVANATDALILCLKCLDIGPGDEVITVPNSFIATAGAIAAVGAKPVFVDVNDDFNMDPNLIQKAITSKTKAILPVHLTGRPANMTAILKIATENNLPVLEDAAQAVGAEHYGKKVGSWGIAGCFSLHPLKNLNASGDGGIITVNDPTLYQKLVQLRNHGLRNRDEADFWGYNSRLDSLQAAIVNVKMNHLEQWTARIREIASRYQHHLAKVVKVPFDQTFEKAVYHTFIIESEQRDQLQSFLLERGIETKIHYRIPLHLQPAAKNLGYTKGDFPKAEKQVERILSLPIYPELTDQQIDYVIQQVTLFHHLYSKSQK